MRLKAMTLNLLFGEAQSPAGAWSARLPLVLDVFAAAAPDVVCLQEATRPQLADLEATLTEYAVVHGPERGQTRLPRLRRRAATRDAEHCAILYRKTRFHAVEENAFWLSHRPHHPGSVLPGTWLPRVVNWVRLQENESTQRVSVYNAHLDFLPWAPPRSARILREMLDAHWDGAPQLLMGDFNAPPRSSAYRHLGQELKQGTHPPLVDAWLAAAERDGPEGTYHGGTGRVRWTGRLDRILFRPSLLVERVATLTHCDGATFPSDHYPVIAELFHPPIG